MNNLTSHYASTLPGATNGSTNKTFEYEKELEDSKMDKEEEDHIYNDPNNFQFLSPPQARPVTTTPSVSIPSPSELPRSYNTAVSTFNQTSLSNTQTIPYSIARAPPKANGVPGANETQYSELDASEKPAQAVSSDVAANEAKVDTSVYSQLDVATMPSLHYTNVGSSAVIPNAYEYLPSITPVPPPTRTTQTHYSEPSPPSQQQPNASNGTPSQPDQNKPNNYQPLLPPPRVKKQPTLYQPLGPPVGYAAPTTRNNTPQTESDAPQTSTFQPNSDVPQPSLGGWNGPVQKPRVYEDQRGEYENVEGNQEQDSEYVEMSSPTLKEDIQRT